MAIGANVPDENLIPGWNSQGNFALASTVGTPGQGYATSGVVPASPNLSASSQALSGYPQPPGALNIGTENAGSQTVPVLTNPGYADGSTLLNVTPLTAPNVTTAGVQNPFGLNAQTTMVVPTGVTAMYVAPFQSTGQPAGTSAPWVQVQSAAFGSTTTATVSVPPAGYIKTVGANVTSTTWTPTN